jgi:hypothetical protein
MTCNPIKIIKHEGLHSKEAKAKIPSKYFTDVVWTAAPVSSDIDFQELYPNRLNLLKLSKQFKVQTDAMLAKFVHKLLTRNLAHPGLNGY